MVEQAKYKFSYRKADRNPFRQSESVTLDIPGHKVEYKVRTNTLVKGEVGYNVRCTCKWIDKEDGKEKYVPKRMILWRYKEHIDNAKKQGAIDV